jgi:hypothetical protein
MSISAHLPCGMQDAQLDNWLDLVLSYAPQVACPTTLSSYGTMQSAESNLTKKRCSGGRLLQRLAVPAGRFGKRTFGQSHSSPNDKTN